MRRAKRNVGKFHRAHFLPLAAAILLAACLPYSSAAQQPGQKTFASPNAAAKALAAAAQSNDTNALLDILGPEGKEIVSSGDPTEDSNNRANFARRYQQMHRLVKEPNGTTMLYIGAENWPCPIPIVSKGDLWFFDSYAGKREILFRRVGRNEMSAIRVSQELVAAQKEYFSEQHEYAQKIFSDEGRHDGLYWKAAEGEAQSPIGPLVASAVAEGYAKGRGGPSTPYHGYYFHILTRQGKNAPGGAKDYTTSGKMTDGFAFVAYPAQYRSSGVMTFIVGPDGVVFQKDLGKKTEALAEAMKEYNPSSSWKKAEEPPAEAATNQPTK
jgi:Protein of unknown function (DUF2950)